MTIFLNFLILFLYFPAYSLSLRSANPFNLQTHSFYMVQGQGALQGSLYGIACGPSVVFKEAPQYLNQVPLMLGDNDVIPSDQCKILLNLPVEKVSVFYDHIHDFYKQNLVENYRGVKPIEKEIFAQYGWATARGIFVALTSLGFLKHSLYDPLTHDHLVSSGSQFNPYVIFMDTMYILIWIYSIYLGDIPLHKLQSKKELYTFWHQEIISILKDFDKQSIDQKILIEKDKSLKIHTLNHLFCKYFNSQKHSISIRVFEEVFDEIQTTIDNQSVDDLSLALGNI